jgi:hypothetical protein
MSTLDELPLPSPRRRWVGPALFVAFVVAVLSAAYAAVGRDHALHGADFVTGLYLDLSFRAPHNAEAPVVHAIAWPLSQGSGSLQVRFETRRAGAASVVTSVRVAPWPHTGDSVDASVRLTGYDSSIELPSGERVALARATLECTERAADGEHSYTLELLGDGTWRASDLLR